MKKFYHYSHHTIPNTFYKKVIPFGTFKEVQSQVIKLGIDKAKDYRQEQKLHNNWPSAPYKYYKDEWKGWNEFFKKIPFI